MIPAALLAQARAEGAEFTIVDGKLATRGVPPELRPDVLRHRAALVALLSASAFCTRCNRAVTDRELVHIDPGVHLHHACGRVVFRR